MSEKDEELRRIKKVAGLSPTDINKMATNNNYIEVLQNIAMNNQLSHALYSTEHLNHKENKAILNHPFYQNLPNKKNDVRSTKNKDSAQNKIYMPQPILRVKTNVSDKNGASRRYMNECQNRQDQESLQSISSVSIGNEISAATDMQLDDFFDPSQKLGNKETYQNKRDHHKVKQILEKSREVDRFEILRQITPIKSSKNFDDVKSTNGKTNPFVQNGYAKQFAKRKMSKEGQRKNMNKYIKNSNTSQGTFEGRSKSVSAKSMNNESDQVRDLKEARDQEKYNKQTKIGCFGTSHEEIISKSNFSQMNKNYAINVGSLRSNGFKENPNTRMINKENNDSKTDRSLSNISQNNKTHDSLSHKGQILSDEKRALFSDERNKTQDSIPKGILELRKQMLNQEYQALEEAKELREANNSPKNSKDIKKSEYDTPRDIAEEYANRYKTHEFFVNNRS